MGATVRSLAPEHDVVLIHDPELIVSAAGAPDAVVVWDVHEDTAVAIAYKDWIPRGLSRAAAVGVRVGLNLCVLFAEIAAPSTTCRPSWPSTA